MSRGIFIDTDRLNPTGRRCPPGHVLINGKVFQIPGIIEYALGIYKYDTNHKGYFN